MTATASAATSDAATVRPSRAGRSAIGSLDAGRTVIRATATGTGLSAASCDVTVPAFGARAERTAGSAAARHAGDGTARPARAAICATIDTETCRASCATHSEGRTGGCLASLHANC